MSARIRLVQRHSDNHLLVHVVWTTARRAALLELSADRWLADVLRRDAYEAGSALIACGNAADHVHVLVRYPSTVTLASVVQRLKGASSYEWNLAQRSPRLDWQVGSWAASVSPADSATVAHYVERQRVHHGDTAPARERWEEALGPLASPDRDTSVR